MHSSRISNTMLATKVSGFVLILLVSAVSGGLSQDELIPAFELDRTCEDEASSLQLLQRFANRRSAAAAAAVQKAGSSPSCTSSDMDAIGASETDLNFEGGFLLKAAYCSTHSWTAWESFSEDKYRECISSKVKLSENCSTCFVGRAKSFFNQCQKSCLESWCSRSCIDCTNHASTELKECVGDQMSLKERRDCQTKKPSEDDV
eukprot:TRINITY_DN3884_c1_g3_i1.p1 TRINITY_DN3884_c1_g3~~TRINITY_DN3884_c1_g3_i1.p1  ORF type:complete len:204 (-),score=34.47 TRINITY_DN3884_c1_g3_i1:130-741(-)